MHQATRVQSRAARAVVLLGVLGLGILLGFTKRAQAEEAGPPMLALIEWKHPFPAEVSYFRVHFSNTKPKPTEEGTAIQVGLPGSRGRYNWSFSVQPKQTVWVAVQAMGPTGLGSPLSEWREYQWQQGGGELGLPGRPVLVESVSRAGP
ncbi:MAG: hypothetical protein VX252_02340 [Myxococcota bacterium]|nr:hypothetical protein [Myxococcota bacterium]